MSNIIETIPSFDASESEELLIGAVLTEPEVYCPVAQKMELKPETFGSSIHQKAFSFFSELHAQGESLDLQTLCAQYKKKVEELGGQVAVAGWAMRSCPDDFYFRKHAGIVKKEFARRETYRQGKSLLEELASGDTITGAQDKIKAMVEVLEDAEGDSGPKAKLVSRAYEIAFNPARSPPEEEICLTLGDDHPVAARGNLTAIQGQAKAGKSAVVSAVLGAAIRGNHAVDGDLFQFDWHGSCDGAIVHLDTEQSPSDWHGLVKRAIHRSGMHDHGGRMVSVPAVSFTRTERLDLLEGILEKEADRLGKIDIVLIDGIADLCMSPNDEGEALELVSKIHALSHKFDCSLFSILHENPGSDLGKTRGHLGSELTRKAFANLRVDKDLESGISTIFGTQMRKRDIPKNQGFCFAWDDDAGMHVYQGRHAGLQAAEKERSQVEQARELWEPIFEKARQNGTGGPCPVLSVDQAMELIRDTNGTGNPPKRNTLKKWMQRAEGLGVLRKADRGKWSLNPNGTNGT